MKITRLYTGPDDESHFEHIEIELEDAVDVEIGGGTVRCFSTGDILLVEDTTGRGHKSKAVNNEARTSAFLTRD